MHDKGKSKGRQTKDIAVIAGRSHVISLRSEGSCVAAGSNAYGRCDLVK